MLSGKYTALAHIIQFNMTGAFKRLGPEILVY